MRFPRPDVVALLVEALDSDSHAVSSGEDEFLDASAGPRSVLQVSSCLLYTSPSPRDS